MPSKPTTQLEEDHQRLLKGEKDLRKQMNKQRIHQLKAANEDEDKNIKKLEKLLKINKTKGTKKIPKMFHDGLDYALEMCLPENIEKMYAAAKEAADAGDESNDDWQQDFAIATGQTNEPGATDKKKDKHLSEKQAAAAAAALKKKVKKLRKIEKKYFDDSDLDSDLSDVDSEFGEQVKADSLSNESGDDSNGSLNHDDDHDDDDDDDDSDDEAPEEVQTKSTSSTKRRLEKEEKNALALNKNGSQTPEDDDDDDEISEKDISDEDDSDEADTPDSGEEDISMESDDEKAAKKSNVWEDIYGRKRNKDGTVLAESESKKYIPPHLRARMEHESSVGAEMDADPVRREKLLRLKRVLKGYINRLSEANMHKITTDIDNLYMQNPRHDMNETLTALICDAIISNALSPERMVLEHALLIAALHANIGSEVGAHILQTLINRFDAIFRQGIDQLSVEDKTLDNVLLLLCHMYTFRVSKSVFNIHSSILRFFLIWNIIYFLLFIDFQK